MTEHIEAHCSRCRGARNCLVLSKHEHSWEEGDQYGRIWQTETHFFLKCFGCNYVFLRKTYEYSEDPSDVRVEYYPAAISRAKPDWYDDLLSLPNVVSESDQGIDLKNVNDMFVLREFLKEIYESLHVNCLRLVAMGIRGLVEFIMVNQVSDQGNFQKNVEKFYANGHLTFRQRKILEDIIELGHGAAHRQFNPTLSEVNTALDIVENIIAGIYVHPLRAHGIADRVPTRKRLRSVQC